MLRYNLGSKLITNVDTVYKTIALCCVANFINAADRVIMPIAIIPLADKYGWTFHEQGWILSAFSVGYMSSMVLGGSAAKQFGGKKILAIAVSLWSFSTLITPSFAFSVVVLVFLRFVLGVGEGIGLPTSFDIFARCVPVEERSRAFGYLIALGSVGQTVATLICPHLSWSIAFRVFGFIGIVWVVVWLTHGYNDGSIGINVGPSLELGPTTTGHSPAQLGGGVDVPWMTMLTSWPLWAIYIAHFSMNWSNYIIMQWLPTYLVRHLGASNSQIMFTALPYITNCLGSIAAGHAADWMIRSQRWSVLAVRRFMTGIGLIGPGLLLLVFSASDSVPVALLLISLTMGLSAANSAGHLSSHGEVAPNHAGITFAISNTLATIPGILCGPLTAELVMQSSGRWFPVFVLAGFINLSTAIVYISQSAAHSVI